jgi:hypothetical protein
MPELYKHVGDGNEEAGRNIPTGLFTVEKAVAYLTQYFYRSVLIGKKGPDGKPAPMSWDTADACVSRPLLHALHHRESMPLLPPACVRECA